MLNGNYVPIDFIIERLFKNSFIFKKAQINEYDLAELVGDALLLIGAKPQYQDNFARVEIDEYRGQLPCKPVVIEGIRNLGNSVQSRTSNDMFAGSPNRGADIQFTFSADQYVLKGNTIHMTTMRKGTIEIKYQSLLTDERGFPMIPDNERYAQAVEAYVKYKVYLPMWEIGEIRDAVWQRAEQEWLFYVNSAKMAAIVPSQDQAETIKNSLVRLIQDFGARTGEPRLLGGQQYRRI